MDGKRQLANSKCKLKVSVNVIKKIHHGSSVLLYLLTLDFKVKIILLNGVTDY